MLFMYVSLMILNQEQTLRINMAFESNSTFQLIIDIISQHMSLPATTLNYIKITWHLREILVFLQK